MIYQVHKEHGWHMAATSQEAKENEKNGWKTVSEKEFYNRPKAKPEESKTEAKK